MRESDPGLHRRRVKSAGTVALICGETSISYDRLAERIDRLADALTARHITRGDRVAYLGENEPAFLETFFAVTDAGRGLRAAEHPAGRAGDRRYMLGDSGAASAGARREPDPGSPRPRRPEAGVPRVVVGAATGTAESFGRDHRGRFGASAPDVSRIDDGRRRR